MGFHRFNLETSGVARVLGPLEARIMEVVWDGGTPTVREIVAALGPTLHYKTVLTVANRLVDKGLLVRQPSDDRAFCYTATESRQSFLDRVSSTVATGLLGEFGPRALAQFVEAAEGVDPGYLDELESLVRARKEQR